MFDDEERVSALEDVGIDGGWLCPKSRCEA